MSDITIGYMLQDGRLVVVDEEQVVVAEIRAMHAQGKTLREIAGDLNDRGIVGKDGGKYTASAVLDALKDADGHWVLRQACREIIEEASK
jgi:hypothetical protein